MKNSVYGKPVFGYKGTKRLLYAVIFTGLFSSCSLSKQIGRQANTILLQDSIIGAGHVGISIYEPATGTYLYNYNASKYFIPASNTKLFTLYAGMKYLGDSLVGLRYNKIQFNDPDSPAIVRSYLRVEPSGDPTFLHPAFARQNVYEFLKESKSSVEFVTGIELDNMYGPGWAWDDYNDNFMVARSAFPVYGNVITFKGDKRSLITTPPYLNKTNAVFINDMADANEFYRSYSENKFYANYKYLINFYKSIPIIPRTDFVLPMLSDTLRQGVFSSKFGVYHLTRYEGRKRKYNYSVIHSQPTDSLLKPMMHNSDNFFAEQTLLMASNQHLGYMNDEAIIDTLLKSDFKDIPQQPRWVDGSGLSRYNLFTPQSFIYILNKLKNEFGLERLKVIFPTGAQGTLKNYYNADSGFIYAKTGSMSNQFTICGYLTTKKNKLLLFSVLINNEMGSAADVRRAVERFIKSIRSNY